MSILCWNARGLGDPRAVRRFHFAIRKLSPSIVFVSETKISSHRISSLRRSLHFENGFGVDSEGSKGGLALFGNRSGKLISKAMVRGILIRLSQIQVILLGVLQGYMVIQFGIKDIFLGNF